MNWIDSHSWVDKGVPVGSYRINCLLFADDLVLLALFQQSSACTRLVFSCVRLRRNENQHLKIAVLCLCKPKAVYAASARQYAAASGEVQAPRSGICEWRQVEWGHWYTDWLRSSIFVKPHQWPTPSESIAIYCVRKLVSCVAHLQSCAKVDIWNKKKKLRTVAKIKTQNY